MRDESVYIKKSKAKKKKRSFIPTLTFFLVIVGFAASSYLAYEFAVNRNERFEAGYEAAVDEDTAVEFLIPYNSSTDEIANLLLQEGLIKSTMIYKVISNIFGYDGRYTSGTHLLNKEMEYEDIMLILTSNPEVIRITIPEGFTLEQIKARLIANGLAKEDKFDEVEDDFDLEEFEKISVRLNKDYKLEGYLFPDTYEFDKNAGEEFIIKRLLKRFEEIFDQDMVDRAEQMERSIDEIVIMASLLEKEASTYDERRKIAGVFYNRLSSEDGTLNKLQCDSTIQYVIVKNGGTPKEFLSVADTRINDRYNTYIYPGLPPGPICNPGLESIMAALYPESHDFYYFVIDPNEPGRHIFSKTFDEHLDAMGKNNE